MQLNRFRALTENSYLLVEGTPFVAEKVTIIRPIIPRIRSPEFSLFTSENQLISGFYKVSDCFNELLIGGRKDYSLIWFWRGDFGFDLFKKNLPTDKVKEMLITGEFINEFKKTHINKLL
jgi:hypothetical protein